MNILTLSILLFGFILSVGCYIFFVSLFEYLYERKNKKLQVKQLLEMINKDHSQGT